MAKLTKEEQETYDRLKAREEEPDEGTGRSAVFNVDLSDPAAVKRAIKAGFLPADFEAEEGDGDGDGDEGDEEGDGDGDGAAREKTKKTDKAPRRRLTGADKWAGGKTE